MGSRLLGCEHECAARYSCSTGKLTGRSFWLYLCLGAALLCRLEYVSNLTAHAAPAAPRISGNDTAVEAANALENLSGAPTTDEEAQVVERGPENATEHAEDFWRSGASLDGIDGETSRKSTAVSFDSEALTGHKGFKLTRTTQTQSDGAKRFSKGGTKPLEAGKKEEGTSDGEYDDPDGRFASGEWFWSKGSYDLIELRSTFPSLEDRFRKWLASHRATKKSTNVCKQAKKDGRIPSAAYGDSPLKSFGYPEFDEETGLTILRSRLPLTPVSGFLTPIRVGAEDYYIQGTYDKIIAFLECFEEYEVIGSTLATDGHWVEDPEQGPLYVQIQNTREGVRSPIAGIRNALFRIGFAHLAKALRINAISRRFVGVSYDDILKGLNEVRQLSEFLPSSTTADVLAAWEDVMGTQDRKKQLASIVNAVTQAITRARLDPSHGWEKSEAVDLSAPLTMALTTYPRPAHGVRATLTLPSNRVTLGAIRDTLPKLFQQSLLGQALLAAVKRSSDAV
ncbi:hypothetical protein BESB_079850 [Besnoitia besnoiti]|uniref:Uncharacterized protein n=1 Tax=Besnoitia besnoiti TaxID=94643 RepID=A0A2A9M745_BESBE|nr:hypothetical protein BESB_079850 [Besnoitia besnoiti]PFH33769.1 hypothetical protein BESB_079850 [Besnoitia besnoiti]